MGCCGSSEEDAKRQRRSEGNNQQERRALKKQSQQPQTHQHQATASGGGGRTLGGGGGEGRRLGGTEASGDARSMAAQAALARQEKSIPGFTHETSKDMKGGGTAAKEALIADIQILAGKLNEDVPIGLPSCSVEQLKRHKQHMQRKMDEKKKSLR